ncbi:BlaI/MecI/CopY family transcriptional regulator [Paenibacillus sp. MMO-177]|uniref:BlaI/MecI/CopY family transcriptional regulator n=1 Tax=Paenibacillus sp. MMO-177 TaxID=3081289 RepID=UPI00301B1A18
MKIKKINMEEEGLLRFFGTLELKIMNLMWKKEKLTIKQAHELINHEDPISLNAVMTVMIRLVDKGLLYKETTGKSRNRLTYFYPVHTKDQFINEQTKIVTDELIDDFGSVVVIHFIERLDKADASLIEKLQRKLEEMNGQ